MRTETSLRRAPAGGHGDAFEGAGKPAGGAARQGRTTHRVGPALVALAAAAALGLVPLPRPSRSEAAIEDLGHMAMGAVLAAWLWTVFRHPKPACRALATSATTAIFLAALEFAQPLVGRTASAGDALLGAGGAAAAGLLALSSARRSATLAVAAVLMLGLASWGPASTLVDVLEQERAFPLLASFESRRELGRWSVEDATVSLAPTHATEGRSSLRVALQLGAYPGIELEEPPTDWTGHVELRFDAHLEGGAPLLLSVRIVDALHDGRYEDRFNGEVLLRPGANRVSISLEEVRSGPRSRILDLRRARGLMLFVPGLTTPRVLFLDDVRLVPAGGEPGESRG